MADVMLRATSGKRNFTVDLRSEYVSVPPSYFRHKIPVFVLRDEAYYWTHERQSDERVALDELERGEGKVFDDPEEAVRWLNSPEDE